MGKGHIGFIVGELDGPVVGSLDNWTMNYKTIKLYNYRTRRDYSTHVQATIWRLA
jgi:hypothetical protein